jgi:hypothetical protein
LARSSYGSDGGSSYQDSAVVNSLLKKLRPNDRSFDRSFSPDRPTGGAKPLSSIRSVRPVRPGAVWASVSLGVLLGAALPEWPYDRACGSWLLLYLSAVLLVVIAGLWGARISWKGRIGWAHVLAVITIIWGLALTAHEVLPRVGYAKARLAWRCHDGHAAATSVPPFSVAVRLVETSDRAR